MNARRPAVVRLTVLAVVTTTALALGAPAGARAQWKADEFTARITAELDAHNPRAAELFTQANRAADSLAWDVAEARYRQVIALEPAFYHAKRRLCSTLVQERRRAEALVLCREAWKVAHTPENRGALVHALAVPIEGDTPSAAALSEAVTLAQDIVADTASDRYALASACIAALGREDLPLLRACVARLDRVAPAEVPTNYFGYIVAASDREWGLAEARIRRAEAAGLPADAAADARRALDRARPWWPKLLRLAGLAAGAWVAGVLLLVVAGALLSLAALRAAQRVATVQTGDFVGLEARLRRAYRAVLWVCCVYYYLSIPLVLVAVVGVGAGLIYGLFAAGYVPLKLVALVVMVAVVTIGAIAKSILARPTKADPGVALDAAAHPRLQAVLGEVAGRIGTRPVDGVYLTPGTEFAVMERGGMLAQMRGATERCLILGVGVLEGLRLGPFKSILAHEYGHFSNQDTAGGGFALAVRVSMLELARGLATGGAAAWYNPAWLFLNAFYRVFLLISHGASRLQEVLADRWAVLAYGAEAFERGLRHVITRSVGFEAIANATIKEVIDLEKPLTNLYAYRPAHPPADAEVDAAVTAVLNAPPSAYDSHPAPAQRIAWAHGIAARPTGLGADAEEEAWGLFTDRLAIESRMTVLVRHNVEAAHGVAIAGVPA
jgi:Zn-dependent protease with chaperone function